jgi:tetratricopeptide (TPR) repeat protein
MEKGLDLDPMNGRYLWDYGNTYTFLREYEKAEIHIKHALSMEPDLIDPYYRLAQNYRLWDGSPERGREALEAMPGRSHPVAVYSWIIQELYERDYERVLKRLRASKIALFEMPRQILPASLVECECYHALGQFDAAARSCENAGAVLVGLFEESPEDPRIHSALGKTYALLGRKAEAIRHGEKAVALWPVSKDAYDGIFFEEYLAEIYALSDEQDLAVEKLDYLLSIPSLISARDLQFNPHWDSLRDNPRFQALLEKYEAD